MDPKSICNLFILGSGCQSGTQIITDQRSFENLPSNVRMISEANCYLNGLKRACSFSPTRDFKTISSTGFGILGNNENVGALELKFNGEIGSSIVEIDYTREDAWDKTCDVELLKNGKVIDSVPNNQGSSRNDRTKSKVHIVTGDNLILREGADGSTCGVHIYGIKVHCNGKLISYT